MAARRSFARTMGKFQSQTVGKPVAILTAFQGGTMRDATGLKITDPKVRLAHNRQMNSDLVEDLKRLNLSFYPVNGAGQEERQVLFGLFKYIVPSREESFVVQPRDDMPETSFVPEIKNLLQKYRQFAALVKVPSKPQAFLLRSDGRREDKGSEVRPRTLRDAYYTQLKAGPRADPAMLSPWEFQGERNPVKRLINRMGGRSAMNQPADRFKIGRRFAIKPTTEEI